MRRVEPPAHQAMALAMIYPEPKRGAHSELAIARARGFSAARRACRAASLSKLVGRAGLRKVRKNKELRWQRPVSDPAETLGALWNWQRHTGASQGSAPPIPPAGNHLQRSMIVPRGGLAGALTGAAVGIACSGIGTSETGSGPAGDPYQDGLKTDSGADQWRGPSSPNTKRSRSS